MYQANVVQVVVVETKYSLHVSYDRTWLFPVTRKKLQGEVSCVEGIGWPFYFPKCTVKNHIFARTSDFWPYYNAVHTLPFFMCRWNIIFHWRKVQVYVFFSVLSISTSYSYILIQGASSLKSIENYRISWNPYSVWEYEMLNLSFTQVALQYFI